jgi:hypothetical protein
MAADMQGVLLGNIYAPSGAGRRQEREEVLNMEVPYLVRTTTSIIIGDFNIVLNKTESTGHYSYSRALT